MTLLADCCTALVDLVEAEGRSIRRSILRLLVAAVLLVAATALILATIGLVVFGLYLLLAPSVGSAGAAFITAAIVLLPGVILIASAKWYAA